jgi:spore maturation protein CgeB
VRVLIADTYYPALVSAHYRRRPELAEAPYAEQHRELLKLWFGTSDAYSHAFRSLGHEAAELVVNCPPLQRAWAREAGLTAPLRLMSRGPRAQRLALLWIALEQVTAREPDVLYVQDLWFFPRAALARLRHHARLVAGQIASPAPPGRTLRGYKFIATSFPHFVDRFRAIGVDAEYLPLAFDVRVLDELRRRGVDPSPAAERTLAAAFVGGVDERVHARGTRMLERASAAADLEVWGYGRETLPSSSPILARHRGEAWGIEMYETLARAKIVLNRHIDAAEGNANNMRLYEATGVGAMLLTDRGRNLPELFQPGVELVVYEDSDDLVDKLQHYLQHKEERVKVAAAGQRRTLAEHTYERRTAKLVAMFESRL